MKKLLSILHLILLFHNVSHANINIYNFKKDLEKLSLEEKAFFCFPVLEFAQYDYMRIMKFIEENNDINDSKKKTEIQKMITAFKGVFYYQTIISFYWFENDNSKIPKKPNMEYVDKLLKANEISKKSEEYLEKISTKEFTDNKIVTTCLKSLEAFFTQNKKVLKIREFLKENEKFVEEEGIKRGLEIINDLDKKL